MDLSEFDYYLPPELIAQEPLDKRDESRLLILNRQNGQVEHSFFYHLPEKLNAGDVLVINDTKVLPARLYAHKSSGAVIELVLLRELSLGVWQTLARPGKKVKPGTLLYFPEDIMRGEVIDYGEDGTRIVRFNCDTDFYVALDKIGQMPLPPYIKKPLQDKDRYQPVYAKYRGSAAAPTAGLHFTPQTLAAIEEKGVKVARVLLHVGLGTFRPVKVQTIEEHKMHAEYYKLNAETASLINSCRAAGGRVIAVGTTSTRVLETVADENGFLKEAEGWTKKYIYPGYRFKIVDGMVTNFHLPKSTLIMMISAFAGRENVLAAYGEAIAKSYRFFSFGDAMLIV